MSDVPTTVTSVIASFELLNALVIEVVDTYRADPIDIRPPHKSGSVAWKDLHAQRRFASAWSQAPILNAQSEALRYLASAEDHLRAAAHLVLADGVVLSPISLGRTVVTASATAVWLVRSNVTTQERLRRSMSFRIRTLEERLQYCDDDSATRKYKIQLDAELQQISDLSADLGMAFKTSKTGRRYIDQPIPSDTQLMREFFADYDQEEGESRGMAEFVQRFYSAAVHANANNLAIGTLVRTGTSRDGAHLAAISLSAGETARYLQTMTYSFTLAYEVLISYFGHGESPAIRKAWDATAKLSRIAVSGT